MTEASICADCGARLPPDAPAGFCPHCLMAAGAAIPSQGGSAPSSASGHEFNDPPKDVSGLDTPSTRFGDYDLLEEIARGGMGIVYRVRQRSLERIVAVKLILAGQFATKEFVRRFRTEASTAAVLQHPNIVSIHEVGVHEGRHFFSMDYVEGHNLAQLVGQRPLDPHQAARYLTLIADAVHYAHERGILHRDLKPSNVLVDSATDLPRITDFGLARRLDGESSLTVTGQVLGSPNFMPPEQTGEGHGQVSRQSDVYGLGAILYYLITARAPFQAESLAVLVAQVISAEPIAPRLLNPAVPRDLETICLKCLEKEPSQRYTAAKALRDELGRFLAGEPILARPVSRVERAWRWCRRKPALATLGAIAVALLLVVLVGAPIALVRIHAARGELEKSLYIADMKLVSEAVRDGAYNYARELLQRHRPGLGKAFRGFEWRYFWKLLDDREAAYSLQGLPAPTGWQDGSLIVRGNILYNQSGAELRAWNSTTWEALPLSKPALPVWAQWIWSPTTGSALAVDNTNLTLTVYRLPMLDVDARIPLPGVTSTTAMSPDGQVVAASVVNAAGKHQVMVWSLSNAVEIARLGTYDSEVSGLVFSPDKTNLMVLGADGILGLWDIAASKTLPTPPDQGHPRRYIAFFPQGKRLLYVEANCFHIWDIGAEKTSALTVGGIEQLNFYGFSPRGDYLLTSINRQEVNLLDSVTLQLAGILRGHSGFLTGSGYSPDGNLLATASVDQTVRIWDLSTQRAVATLGGLGERISDVKFTSDGQSLVAVTGLGRIKVYDRSKVLNNGLFANSSTPQGIIGLAISPDQRTLATRAIMGTITLWNRTNRTPFRTVPLDDQGFGNLVFAPNGKSLAWVGRKALRLLSLDSEKLSTFPVDGSSDRGEVAFSPEGDELAYACRTQLMVLELKSQHSQIFAPSDDEVVGVAYSPDGRFLAFGNRLGLVTLCDHRTKRILDKEPKVQPTRTHVYDVAFSPDSRLLAACSGDSLIKLWAVTPGGLSLRSTLRGHLGFVMGVAFSPDGGRLVSAGGDQTIKLWDVEQGVCVATLYGHNDYVGQPTFTRDGNAIYSCGFGADRQIRFWDAGPLSP